MGVNFSVKGMDYWWKMLDSVGQVFDEEILDSLDQEAIDWRDDTRANSPEDTGELRKHFDAEETRKVGKEFEVEVYNTMEYSGHVEYGHRTRSGGYVKGEYTLTKSTERAIPEVERAGNEAVERAVKRLDG